MTASATNSRELSPPVMSLPADPLVLGVAFALVLTIAQRGVGFLRGILFCRLMPDDALGQWSVIWSALMLLAPLAVLGLPGSFSRYAEHYLQRGQLRPYLRRIAWIGGTTTLLMACAMLLFPVPFSMILFRETDHVGLVRVMALALVLVAGFNGIQSLMESLRQVRTVTMMRFYSGVVFAVAAVGLLLIWENGTMAVVVGFGISCLVGLWPAIWFFVRHREVFRTSNQPLAHSTMWGRVLPFALWLWVANFLVNSCDSIDRFLLLHLSRDGSEAAQSHLGQYHSSQIIPQLLIGLAVVIGGTLLPYLAAAWERRDYATAHQQLRWTLKVTALGFLTVDLLILMFAPVLFDVALQGRYADGLAVMPLTMMYSFWFGLVLCAQNGLWCCEKMRWVVGGLSIGLVVNVLLNCLFIPTWGMPGAALATTLANGICLATLLLILRHLQWPIDRGTWTACALPIIMVLPPIAAGVAWSLIAFGAWRSDWFFDLDEKRLIRDKLLGLRNRLEALGSRWTG